MTHDTFLKGILFVGLVSILFRQILEANSKCERFWLCDSGVFLFFKKLPVGFMEEVIVSKCLSHLWDLLVEFVVVLILMLSVHDTISFIFQPTCCKA